MRCLLNAKSVYDQCLEQEERGDSLRTNDLASFWQVLGLPMTNPFPLGLAAGKRFTLALEALPLLTTSADLGPS